MMADDRPENVTSNATVSINVHGAGGEKAANALQPDNQSRHATTAAAKVLSTIPASPLVR
jgi:hypothetical protein